MSVNEKVLELTLLTIRTEDNLVEWVLYCLVMQRSLGFFEDVLLRMLHVLAILCGLLLLTLILEVSRFDILDPDLVPILPPLLINLLDQVEVSVGLLCIVQEQLMKFLYLLMCHI